MSRLPTLQLLSDTHFERYRNLKRDFPWTKADFVGDILLLTGDISSRPADIGAWLRAVNRQGRPVVMVIGNHEAYGRDLGQVRDEIRAAVDRRWFHLLERKALILDGIRFLGTTLWTDFAQGLQLDACRNGMNDFRVIREGDALFHPEDAWAEYRRDVRWLAQQFTSGSDQAGLPTVVLTHHAPSFRSQHPQYAASSIRSGFCSALDDQVESWAPALWAHGHVHDSVDYRIGPARIVANPCGYPREGRYGLVLENPRWNPQCLLDLDQEATPSGRPARGRYGLTELLAGVSVEGAQATAEETR
ncbi:metallophosphoesterase [Thiomonas sp.]